MTILYKKIVCMMPTEEPSDRILRAIFERVEAAERLRLRVRAASHAVLLVGACAAFVPSVEYLARAGFDSGFSGFVSLAVSDSSYVLAHTGDYALSLATSLPLVGSISCVALLLVVANSLRKTVYYSSSLREHALPRAVQTA